MTNCHGCGVSLAPSKPHGRPRKWCSEFCRRRTLYSGTCIDCGASTYNGTVPPPDRCRPCARLVSDERRKARTRERVLSAIQEWNETYEEPPACPDWNPYVARHGLHDEARARRFEDASPRWPSFMTVIDAFGSWNAAIEAAGFEPRVSGGGNGNRSRARNCRQKAAA